MNKSSWSIPPKTERYGKPYRTIPLFPELRAYLETAFHEVPEGSIYVIRNYRDATNANLRTQLLRILKRAGVVAWERLFHNLRASRQTELVDQFPAKVVSDWLGNSPRIAEQHYLKTTEHHFEKAVNGPGQGMGQRVGRSWGKGWDRTRPHKKWLVCKRPKVSPSEIATYVLLWVLFRKGAKLC